MTPASANDNPRHVFRVNGPAVLDVYYEPSGKRYRLDMTRLGLTATSWIAAGTEPGAMIRRDDVERIGQAAITMLAELLEAAP